MFVVTAIAASFGHHTNLQDFLNSVACTGGENNELGMNESNLGC